MPVILIGFFITIYLSVAVECLVKSSKINWEAVMKIITSIRAEDFLLKCIESPIRRKTLYESILFSGR